MQNSRYLYLATLCFFFCLSLNTQKVFGRMASGADCAVCEFTVKEIDALVEGNRTETFIVEVLDHVCNVLPSEFRNYCDAFVAAEAPDLIKFLLMELNPEAVCTALHFCGSNHLSRPSNETPKIQYPLLSYFC